MTAKLTAWNDRFLVLQNNNAQPSPLGSLRTATLGSLQSAGEAYDAAGRADYAAGAAYRAAVQAWTSDYATAFATVDQAARYSNAQHGGPMLDRLSFKVDASSYGAVRARAVAALALSGLTSTQLAALNASVAALDALWASPPTAAAATQPSTEAALVAALDATDDLMRLLSYS